MFIGFVKIFFPCPDVFIFEKKDEDRFKWI